MHCALFVGFFLEGIDYMLYFFVRVDGLNLQKSIVTLKVQLVYILTRAKNFVVIPIFSTSFFYELLAIAKVCTVML